MKLTRHRHKNTTNKTVKNKYTRPPFDIDVVYTWKGEDRSNDIRLGYNDELKYSLRSIFKFAPWVHKIFILMNPPKKMPSWIKKMNDKIEIIDHFDTFPNKSYLPNTNSNAIETTVPNIKGLSEHFIYFNDDIFLGRKSKYTDFFTPDGKAYIHYSAKTTIPNANKMLKFPPNNNMMYQHIPMPRLKSINLEFNEKYADYIHWIRKTKKRNGEGFDICKKNNLESPCQQIHYPIAKYMYAKQKAVLSNDNYRTYYISNYGDFLNAKLDNIRKLKPLFFCINDTETNPTRRIRMRKQVLKFFKEYYPDTPPFEYSENHRT
tara:strand:+ start:13481 stop:14437 length:957 start_codon:yes stop_codon:yes gene_type:complete